MGPGGPDFPITKFIQLDIQAASRMNQNSPTCVLTSSLSDRWAGDKGELRHKNEAQAFPVAPNSRNHLWSTTRHEEEETYKARRMGGRS